MHRRIKTLMAGTRHGTLGNFVDGRLLAFRFNTTKATGRDIIILFKQNATVSVETPERIFKRARNQRSREGQET